MKDKDKEKNKREFPFRYLCPSCGQRTIAWTRYDKGICSRCEEEEMFKREHDDGD